MHRTDSNLVAFWLSLILVVGITANLYGAHRHVQATEAIFSK